MPRDARWLTVCWALLALSAVRANAATSLEAGGLWSLERSDGGVRGLAGLRFGGLESGRASSHFGLSAFAGNGTGTHLGTVGLMVDLGAGYAAPLGAGGRLVPSLGFTALASAGEGGGGAVLGIMAGVGAVAVPEHGVGARLDATLRWLPSPSEFVLALTAGLVWPGQQR
jgi:hypothetical protein